MRTLTEWHNIYAMPDKVTQAVIAAIEDAPCSVKALADAAGVPQSTLARILSGERNATPEVAVAVAKALEGWSRDCDEAAESVRRATQIRGR